MSDFLIPARVAVTQCMAVKEGETCLIVTDEPLRAIGEALFRAACEAGAEAVLLDMLPRTDDGEEPPDVVAAAMLASDVVLAPTLRSLSHTAARRRASEKGARISTLPGIAEETMVRAVDADYEKIAALSRRVAEILSSAKEAHLTTGSGTDVTFGLDGRAALADTGILHKPGDFGNLPAGEACIAPIEGTTQGTLVVDGAMGDSGLLDSETIVLTFRDGYAVDISGGAAAEELQRIVDRHGRLARNVAELGVGTNGQATVIGNILEDEKVLGTVHVAIGSNKALGGVVEVPLHLDGIVLSPTLEVNGILILENGKLVI